jgi:hypothetical protein
MEQRLVSLGLRPILDASNDGFYIDVVNVVPLRCRQYSVQPSREASIFIHLSKNCGAGKWGKRAECANDILWRAAAKRADDYSRTVTERKSRLVEIVQVACDEYTLKA